MITVLQRVQHAKVEIDGKSVGATEQGLLILLAVAAVIALLAAGVRWLIWELQMPDDWGEDDYYYYDQDQEDEDAPITIPTVEPDADARLELAKDCSHALSAQEVYR